MNTKRLASLLVLILAVSLTAWSAPADPARTAPPPPRPLLLLSPFTGEKLVVRATSARVEGTILQAELENGGRSAWDKAAFVASLPWYTDAELTGGAVDLAALGKVYERAQREHPEFSRGLLAESARVQAVVASREKERNDRVAAVLAARDDPADASTAEDLHRRIRAAEEAAASAPERRAEIDRAVAPFREHLANLEAGKVFSEGQWRTPEEVRQRQAQAAETARRRALEDSLRLPINVQILDAGKVNGAVTTGGIVLAVPVLLGIFLLFRRRRLIGVVLILLPLAAGTTVAALLFSTELPWPAAPGATDTGEASLRAFDAAVSPTEPHLRVSEADANVFLAKHTILQGAPADGAVNLQRIAVAFRPGGVMLCETAEWRGRPVLIQRDFGVEVRDGKPIVTAQDVRVGKMSLPSPMNGSLRAAGLAPALGEFLQQHAPLMAYASAGFTAGNLELVRTAPTPPPVARTVPTPTPTVVETPLPTPGSTHIPEAIPMVAEATPESREEEPELPPLSAVGNTPGPDNMFYVYAIWDGINSASAGDIAKQMDRLRDQLGKGNRYHRVGFAFIMSGNEAQLRTICNLAKQKDLAIGVILGTQTHSGAAKNEVAEDFRAVQWRLSGQGWRGGSGPRDSMVPTPSRYCRLVRDALEKGQLARCQTLKRVMDANPGVITCINGTIEEELAGGGETSDDQLADYSPFAVTEFRDWLRHTGEYDADHGRYAGQGAPESITGHYANIKGKARSPFYDAATPDATANGTSFNGRFGTNFKTWTLKYWDLQAYPTKITDGNFNPMPESGPGFTEGGFDAPRRRGTDRWWQAWSWDYHDNGNRYPPGSAGQPAFGFRQVMIHNFVVDMFRVGLKARLPANLMFAHQLPGEVLTKQRDRSSASPVWAGFLPFNGTVGVTRFGPFDPELALRYTKTNPQSRSWGIFEWHPMPNAKPDDPKLYRAATDNLQTYYRARCHHLFAGWWKVEIPKEKYDFPLADSQFAKAIKDFMNSRPDNPYPGTPR